MDGGGFPLHSPQHPEPQSPCSEGVVTSWLVHCTDCYPIANPQ